MRLLLSLALALAAGGCVTPMSRSEIDNLTVCRDTDLKRIRKSLLLNGYEVKTETDTDLVTDFKQIDGYARNRTLQRITVVKVDARTFTFRVRLKDVRVDDGGSGFMVGSGDRRGRSGSSVMIDLSPPVEVETEEDQEYVEERRDRYYQVQREVCGT